MRLFKILIEMFLLNYSVNYITVRFLFVAPFVFINCSNLIQLHAIKLKRNLYSTGITTCEMAEVVVELAYLEEIYICQTNQQFSRSVIPLIHDLNWTYWDALMAYVGYSMCKQPLEVFLRKGVLKMCSKFTGKYPRRSAISIKLKSNFIEIALRHGCRNAIIKRETLAQVFTCEFCEISKNPFFYRTPLSDCFWC